MDLFGIMTLPFLECLVLVGILTYLGLHVIRRRVIFVDLALAQIAALGTMVAFLFGIDPHSKGAYLYSLAFTFIGAAVFSVTRVRNDRVPQEAIIGLTYALAAAVGILIIFGAPHGAEHIQEVLTGTILWVRASEVMHAAVVCALVGLFHYIFREKFLLISQDPEKAFAEGVNVRLWDFLFYMSFGLVITHSVQVAGILMVFVFLVVPAILAVMLTDRLIFQLAIGWFAGTLVSVSGLAISYFGDLPSGPTVVSLYGLTLVVVSVVYFVAASSDRFQSLVNVAWGICATTLLVFGFWGLGLWISGQPELRAGPFVHHEQPVRSPQEEIVDKNPVASAVEELMSILDERDLLGKTAAVEAIDDRDILVEVWKRVESIESRFVLARRIFALAPDAGSPLLISLMEGKSSPPLFRDECHRMLRKTYPRGPAGYDPWVLPDTKENIEALVQWNKFLEQDGLQILTEARFRIQ